MNEQEALAKMFAPGQVRPSKPYRGGVIQVHITRACDKSCYGCTQGSNLAGKTEFITLEHYEQALLSLKGYWGVVGMFGGNPALHPQFDLLCDLLEKHVPWEQRGLWCNHPVTDAKARRMAKTFNPAVSNLNVHLDQAAYDLFKRNWPACHPVGLHSDSRHSPPYVAMKDLVRKECPTCRGVSGIYTGSDIHDPPDPCPDCGHAGTVPDDEKIWELAADCDINKHWSAMIGVFRGQLRAWFCEIAGAQAMLHQGEPDYPDTGLDPTADYYDWIKEGRAERFTPFYWWQLPMTAFARQVRKHCFDCGIPLRGYGELAQSSDREGFEQVTETHAAVYRPKRKGRLVENVMKLEQLGLGKLQRITDYIGNSRR